jgi:hypothetical protein
LQADKRRGHVPEESQEARKMRVWLGRVGDNKVGSMRWMLWEGLLLLADTHP